MEKEPRAKEDFLRRNEDNDAVRSLAHLLDGAKIRLIIFCNTKDD
jgi:superfamily II DNA/RNA helicase